LGNQSATNWSKRSPSSPTTDVAEALLTATDVKHYLYCPRIVYFERVLHAEPQFESQQEASRDLHERFEELDERRKGALFYDAELDGAEKAFRVSLSSCRLRISGTVDCLIKMEREYIPVDYKNMASNRGRVWSDHKYQLVAYALMIDEGLDTLVRRGYVNYVPEKCVVRVDITPMMKSYVRRIVGHMWRMIEEGSLPPIRVSRAKCSGGCGYKWIC